jgi:hypothetical protein
MMSDLTHDRERLIAALRARGVDYLLSDGDEAEPLTDETLIASLAGHEDARLRSALIALFLLHPELAERVPGVLATLSPAAANELRARYMAAVYLQRFWRTRLEIYGLTRPDLLDLFSAQLGLPAPEVMFGKPGLHELALWHQQQNPVAYNRRVEYELVIEHLVAALKAKDRNHEPAAIG